MKPALPATFTPERARALVDAYASGKPLRELCTSYACSKDSARAVIRFFDVELRPRGGGHRRGKHSFDLERASQLSLSGMTDVEVASALGVSPSSVSIALKNRGVPRRARGYRKHVGYDYDFFAKETPAAAYFAGVIASDGCVKGRDGKEHSVHVGLAWKDRAVLRALKRCAHLPQPVTRYQEWRARADGSQYLLDEAHIEVTHPKWASDLSTFWNVVPRKSLTLLPPPSTTRRDLLPHFIRGVFDGDGGVTSRGYAVAFASSSQPFLRWLRDYFAPLRARMYKKRCKEGAPAWSLQYFGKGRAWRVGCTIYENAESGLYLRRKYLALFGPNTPGFRWLARQRDA